jgi:hypothetical protein
MKIKNNWLILKGKFMSEGFYFEDGGEISKKEVIELKGVEGEIFGSGWVEVKKGVYVNGYQKLVRV